MLVPWPFEPLHVAGTPARASSASPAVDGEDSAWSDPLDIEAGLLDPADWAARAGHGDVRRRAPPQRPIRFRRDFTVDDRSDAGPPLRLGARRVHRRAATARRVGDDVLAPGWTVYRHRLRYQTFDVAELLRDRRQRARADRRRGLVPRPSRVPRWPARRLRRRHRPDRPARAALRRRQPSSTLATDDAWRAALDGRLAASLYDGEDYDARLADAELGGARASTTAMDTGRRAGVGSRRRWSPRPARPCAGSRRCAPWPSSASPSGTTVVDFGQNITGRVRISVRGEAGDEITLRHAEVLERRRAGHVAVAHGGGDRPLRARRRRRRGVRAGVHDPRIPLRRRRRLARRPRLPTPIEAVVCHSDMEPTGSFRLLPRRAQPAPRERAVEHARQLRRRADRLPTTRRTARLDRRHPGVRARRGIPLRLLRPARRRGWPTSPPISGDSAPCRRTCPGSSCCGRRCRRRRGATPR